MNQLPSISDCYKEARKRVAEVTKKIKSKMPKNTYDLNKASFSEIRSDFYNGKPCKRVVIILRGSGCKWALESGGCTMCGFSAAQTRGNISRAEFVEQFRIEHAKYDFSKNPILCLYNNGSYLDDTEMPPETRKALNKIIADDPHIKKVVFETRADSITRSKLKELRQQIPEKEVVLAMGLESHSKETRELCIHKGQPLKTFETAAGLIKEEGLGLRIYILLKPPFLTEAEAINDTIETIRYAETLKGSIHIECCTVQDYTMVEYLKNKGHYRSPWLWSIIEVLKKTDPIQVYVTPFKYIPFPKDVPHNCEICNKTVSRAILNNYNLSFDRSVFEGLDCNCKITWQKELAQEPEQADLSKRILMMLYDYDKE